MADIGNEKPSTVGVSNTNQLDTSSAAPATDADSFVSAPSTPLETQGTTPATTLSTDNVEKQPVTFEAPTSGPCKTVLSYPLPTSKPKVRPALTPEQQQKYDAVLAEVQAWTTIPASSAKGAPAEPIEEYERMWLTKECLQRYLRATKWNTAQAIKRLQASLAWRREYGADKFTADYISPENETGKQMIVGYDLEGRSCWYMTPSRQNTKPSERQIHHVSYMLDRAVELMPPGQETICLLLSFKDSSKGSTPSMALARQALNVLQNHNPERLGKALIMDVPWFVSAFLKLVWPFVDPLTKEKLVFDPELPKHMPNEQLVDWYKGDLKFEYDHSVYWPSLTEETERRRKAYRERWEAAGKQIGENEAYLRGGECKPIREERASNVEAVTAQAGKLDIAA